MISKNKRYDRIDVMMVLIHNRQISMNKAVERLYEQMEYKVIL